MLQLILSVVAVGIFKFVANFPSIILLSITIILHQIFRCLSACLKANSWLLQDEQPRTELLHESVCTPTSNLPICTTLVMLFAVQGVWIQNRLDF